MSSVTTNMFIAEFSHCFDLTISWSIQTWCTTSSRRSLGMVKAIDFCGNLNPVETNAFKNASCTSTPKHATSPSVDIMYVCMYVRMHVCIT